MIQMHYTTSMGWPTAPGAGRRAKMRAQWSTTSRQYIIGWALCAKSAMASHPPLPKPFTATARRTANPEGREAPMSHPIGITTSRRLWGQSILNGNVDGGLEGDSGIPQAAYLGIAPTPLAQPWRRTKWRRCHLPTQHISSPQYSHTQIKWLLSSANLELHKKSTKDAGLHELKGKG